MKIVKIITKIIDSINEWIGKVVSYSSIILMLVVAYEVISRKFFNKPTLWAFETITMVYGFFFMMVLGYGLLKNAHVSVDVVTTMLSKKTQHILSIITYIVLFFPFVIKMIPPSLAFAINSWGMKEQSWSAWAPPVYPIKTVIVIAFTLLLLQGISQFLKSVTYLIEGEKTNN